MWTTFSFYKYIQCCLFGLTNFVLLIYSTIISYHTYQTRKQIYLIYRHIHTSTLNMHVRIHYKFYHGLEKQTTASSPRTCLPVERQAMAAILSLPTTTSLVGVARLNWSAFLAAQPKALREGVPVGRMFWYLGCMTKDF